MRGRIGAILGAEKSGKSRLLCWLLACLYAPASPWGLRVDYNQMPKRILYLAGEEMYEDVVMRLEDYLKALGAKANHAALPISFKEAAGLGLEKEDRRRELFDEMQAEGFDWLICEPMARLHDGKENNNDDMRPMHNFFRAISNRYGVTVTVVHHTGKPNEGFDENRIASWARGASDFATLVDTAMFVKEKGRGEGWRTLSVARAGRFPPLGPLELTDLKDPCEGGTGFVKGFLR